jgi:hypothetical protein
LFCSVLHRFSLTSKSIRFAINTSTREFVGAEELFDKSVANQFARFRRLRLGGVLHFDALRIALSKSSLEEIEIGGRPPKDAKKLGIALYFPILNIQDKLAIHSSLRTIELDSFMVDEAFGGYPSFAARLAANPNLKLERLMVRRSETPFGYNFNTPSYIRGCAGRWLKAMQELSKIKTLLFASVPCRDNEFEFVSLIKNHGSTFDFVADAGEMIAFKLNMDQAWEMLHKAARKSSMKDVLRCLSPMRVLYACTNPTSATRFLQAGFGISTLVEHGGVDYPAWLLMILQADDPESMQRLFWEGKVIFNPVNGELCVPIESILSQCDNTVDVVFKLLRHTARDKFGGPFPENHARVCLRLLEYAPGLDVVLAWRHQIEFFSATCCHLPLVKYLLHHSSEVRIGTAQGFRLLRALAAHPVTCPAEIFEMDLAGSTVPEILSRHKKLLFWGVSYNVLRKRTSKMPSADWQSLLSKWLAYADPAEVGKEVCLEFSFLWWHSISIMSPLCGADHRFIGAVVSQEPQQCDSILDTNR